MDSNIVLSMVINKGIVYDDGTQVAHKKEGSIYKVTIIYPGNEPIEDTLSAKEYRELINELNNGLHL